MKTKARGQLAHKFHGDYWAIIALEFDSPYSASAAASQLGQGWHTPIRERRCLIWIGDSAQLKRCEEILISLGAEGRKIASLAKSIDYGEPFEIQVEITPKEQLSLL